MERLTRGVIVAVTQVTAALLPELPSLNFRSSSVEQTQLQHCSLSTGVASSVAAAVTAEGRAGGGLPPALRLAVFPDSSRRCSRPVATVANPNSCALYFPARDERKRAAAKT